MVGFVGVQARKRKRNRLILILIIIIFFIIFFYLPSLDFSIEEKELPEEILPNKIDDQSSLISEIEELKLAIFQKDQRIKFRDNQIKDLKKQYINLEKSFTFLQNEYDKTVGNFSELESNSSQNSQENINQISNLKKNINDLNNLIKGYKKEIKTLEQEIKNSISSEDLQDVIIENSILKTELNLIKKKYLEAEVILDELKSLINEKQKTIDQLIYLKDQQHHG